MKIKKRTLMRSYFKTITEETTEVDLITATEEIEEAAIALISIHE